MSSPLRLSDPGAAGGLNPAMTEYLRSYEFPLPPSVRYGNVRIASPQEKFRVALHAQAWLPGHATGTVALLHGYSEHVGNYARLVRELVAAQLAVIAFDQRGHGLSEGPAGHAPYADVYAEDAETVIREIFSAVLPTRPLFLFGHSMGGMLGLQLLLRAKLPVPPTAAVLTSPLLGFPELNRLQKVLAAVSPFLAKVTPALPVGHNIPPQNLCHDEIYLAHRQEDPLIKRTTTPRWFESMKVAVANLQSDAEKLSAGTPTLMMLAGAEKVTSLLDARRFAFRAFAGQRHKVIEFPGMYHELEKEPEVRARVVSEAIAWFRSHG